jgi:Cellulase (glycosyl hydrolase family 5)
LIDQSFSSYKFLITKTAGCAIVQFLIISSAIFHAEFSTVNKASGETKLATDTSYIGVDMKGLYTSTFHNKRSSIHFPENYYNDSFKLITDAGLNHIRYVLYWQAFENDPISFIEELESLASLADKWGLHVIYDNHQYHTSSWLDPLRGSGFPPSLFNNNVSYPYGSGGAPVNPSASKWWTNWWNHNITNAQGLDGWTLQIEFLKRVIRTVEAHASTLGYEILNEPQIHSADQWSKIGSYNTFMTNELRKLTNKILVVDMTIPVQFHNPKVNMTFENIAKMLPENKKNVVFKISMYGIPTVGSYQAAKLNLLAKVAKTNGLPLYIGEWNDVSHEEAYIAEPQEVNEINVSTSDLNQTDALILTKQFKELGAWGWAFWNWNFLPDSTTDFNLIIVTPNGNIVTTKYFEILKHAVAIT